MPFCFGTIININKIYDYEKKYKDSVKRKKMPRQWYNIFADMPNKPLPPLNPVTREPIGPEALAAVFPMELIRQEVATERYIDIPEEVLNLYKIYRPSPMYRAINLEKALGTKSKIYYKYEGGNYSGSHKANTVLARHITTSRKDKRMTTETVRAMGSAMSLPAIIWTGTARIHGKSQLSSETRPPDINELLWRQSCTISFNHDSLRKESS